MENLAQEIVLVVFQVISSQAGLLNYGPRRCSGSDVYPGSNNKKGEEIWCLIFFCSHKFSKTENYFIFEQVQKIISTFYPKEQSLALRNMGRGSRTRKTCPGSATLDPEHLAGTQYKHGFTSEESSLSLLLNHLSYPECLLSAQHTEDDNMTDHAHAVLFTATFSYRITQCCGTVTVLVPTIEKLWFRF